MASSGGGLPAVVALSGASTGIQEITRRLQEERDALRLSVEELTRQLNQERSARANLEHELQTKELEIIHEQQRTRQAKQTLQEKIMQLEKELDDEKAMHQMALMGRNVAADKNVSLATEVREIEAKLKKEMAKKDTLAAELEQSREEVQLILLERDSIIQRTEADAKRVRELWDQIIHEHETQNEALRVELDAIQGAKEAADQQTEELAKKIELLERDMKKLGAEKQALEVKIAQSSSDHDLMKSRFDKERNRELDAGEFKNQLQLQLQDARNRCVILEERERIAVREKEMAEVALRKVQADLDSRTEELLALKTEFSDLIDKHERFAEEFKEKSRKRDIEVKLKLQRLEQYRLCSEKIAQLRKREVAEFKNVIRSVNRRLNDVREKQQEFEYTRRPNEVQDAPKSLSIHRQ